MRFRLVSPMVLFVSLMVLLLILLAMAYKPVRTYYIPAVRAQRLSLDLDIATIDSFEVLRRMAKKK